MKFPCFLSETWIRKNVLTLSHRYIWKIQDPDKKLKEQIFCALFSPNTELITFEYMDYSSFVYLMIKQCTKKQGPEKR